MQQPHLGGSGEEDPVHDRRAGRGVQRDAVGLVRGHRAEELEGRFEELLAVHAGEQKITRVCRKAGS